MNARYLFLIMLSAVAFCATGRTATIIAADSVTRRPLAGASVFNRHGKPLGTCGYNGRLPYAGENDFPLTVRYIGYNETSVGTAGCDTVFLAENPTVLPEIVVETRQHKVLHMLAYVREYSTLATFTDTVFLFREKMVDYMLTPDRRVRFKGWSAPRVLKTKSFYRFNNSNGLDSVSDKCHQHFSWSDWMGIPPTPPVPGKLRNTAIMSDTIKGRYSPAEIWTRNDSRIGVDVDVLADTTARRWVTGLSGFFRNKVEFEHFRVRFNYDNVSGDSISPTDITGYSYNIESRGRGHDMFRFNRIDEPFFVSTYAEVYMMDKEYITVKEARKWVRSFNRDDLEIMEPPEAPELQPGILELIARVDAIDSDEVRLEAEPDYRMLSITYGKKNRNFQIGHRALSILKTLTGISSYRANKKFNDKWENFRKKRITDNRLKNKTGITTSEPAP